MCNWFFDTIRRLKVHLLPYINNKKMSSHSCPREIDKWSAVVRAWKLLQTLLKWRFKSPFASVHLLSFILFWFQAICIDIYPCSDLRYGAGGHLLRKKKSLQPYMQGASGLPAVLRWQPPARHRRGISGPLVVRQ